MNKKALAVAIAGALAIPMSASAVQYSISGHVNREIRFADNGAGNDTQFVDNGASMSRVNIKGSEDIGNGLKAGVSLVMGFHANPSSSATLKTNSTNGAIFIRESYLWFSGNWGKVSLGQGSTAADGALFADQSNTWLADEVSSAADHASSIAPNGGGFALGKQFSTFDGNRVSNLRYDSPSFGPVKVAASVAQNSRFDIAAFANSSLAGGELSAAIGYVKNRSNTDVNSFATKGAVSSDIFEMSASYLFSQGTSITGAYSQSDISTSGAPTASQWYVKLGHQWGQHALSVSYGDFSDMGNTSGANGRTWGLGWVYTMRKDVEIYAGYHNYDYTGSANAGVSSVDLAMVGSRIKF